MKAPNEDASNLVGLWQLQSGSKALAGEPNLSVVILAGNPVAATPLATQCSGLLRRLRAGRPCTAFTRTGPRCTMKKTAWTRPPTQIADLGLGWTKLQVRWGSEDYYYDCSGNFGFDWNHTNQVINTAGSKGLARAV